MNKIDAPLVVRRPAELLAKTGVSNHMSGSRINIVFLCALLISSCHVLSDQAPTQRKQWPKELPAIPVYAVGATFQLTAPCDCYYKLLPTDNIKLVEVTYTFKAIQPGMSEIHLIEAPDKLRTTLEVKVVNSSK